MACEMPDPCKFVSLGSCHKRFLRTHKEVDFVPHPVVGLVPQDGEEMRRDFLRHFVSKAWILFSESAGRVHVSQPQRRMKVTSPFFVYSPFIDLYKAFALPFKFSELLSAPIRIVCLRGREKRREGGVGAKERGKIGGETKGGRGEGGRGEVT